MGNLVSGLPKFVSGSFDAAETSIGPIDCHPYRSLTLQLAGTWTATVVVEQSNDNTNWVAVSGANINTGARATSFTANGIYVFAVIGKFLRVRTSAYTSGTVDATGLLSGLAATLPNLDVAVTADTEFPAAAALADDTANPTTTLVGAMLQGFDGTTWDRIRSLANNADAVAALALGNLAVASHSFRFNGATFDRERGNYEETVLASAARTASVNSADLVNYNNKGVVICIDATAITDTPSVVFTVKGKCTLSGKYNTILASAAITGVSTTVLKIHPALTAAANLVANDVLPRIWRVEAVAADADSITYSVSANYI